MSTRAKAAAALASLGVIVVGWQAATANGQTVAAPSTKASRDTSSSGNSSSGNSSSSAAPSASSSASSPASSGTGATGTFTGTTATHHYGSVTVTVTMANGKITKLTENVVSDGDHHSQSINSQAIPVLKQEILSTNSANVSTVSGATYTTQAYLTSLQSALDKAS